MADLKKRMDFMLSEDSYKKLLEIQKYYTNKFKIKFTMTDTINRLIEEKFENNIM